MELGANPHGGYEDARLLGKAVRAGWNIPPEVLAKLPSIIASRSIEQIVTPAIGEDGKPIKRFRHSLSTQVKAARALVAMHGQNIGQSIQAAGPQVQVNLVQLVQEAEQERAAVVDGAAAAETARRLAGEQRAVQAGGKEGGNGEQYDTESDACGN